MKAILTSRKYHPGHLSHLLANFKLLDEAGIDVTYMCNEKYFSFLDNEHVNKESVLKLSNNDFLIVWFPSIKALFDMFFARVLGKGKIVYIFHEPFDSVIAYMNAGFGFKKTIKIVLASVVNSLLVKCAHKVILPSNKAYDTFKLKYNFKGDYARISLMFDDESSGILEIQDRLYISYIGTIASDHAFDDFINFITYCLERDLFPEYTFLIATRSLVGDEVMQILSPFKSNDRLMIVSGIPMSNQTINDYYSKSIVIWNAYKRSMQSGVLAKAYMFGTPVLVRELNQSENFVSGETGIKVPNNCSPADIISAINKILKSYSHFSKCCRSEFLKRFYYKSISEDFLTFIIDSQIKE